MSIDEATLCPDCGSEFHLGEGSVFEVYAQLPGERGYVECMSGHRWFYYRARRDRSVTHFALAERPEVGELPTDAEFIRRELGSA